MWKRVRCVASSSPCTLRRKTADASFASPARKNYAVRGYDFIEGFRALGPNAALSQLKATITLYGVSAAIATWAVVYYFTTRKYLLTCDPDPCHNTRFHQFSSDYAVVENRWTGNRRVIELDPTEKVPNGFVKRTLHVNFLTHRVKQYLHRTKSTVLVDAGPELRPDRFIAKGLRRREAADSAAADSGGRLLFRAELRPLAVRNGYQKGALPLFERAVETAARELLAERFRSRVAARAGPAPGPALAAELMRSGGLSGSGLTLQCVVGDAAEFERAVMNRARERVGDSVVLISHEMAVLQ